MPHTIVRRALALSILVSAAGQIQAQTPAVGATAADSATFMGREVQYWSALKARDTTAIARLIDAGAVDVDVSGMRRVSPASIGRFMAGCQTQAFSISNARVVETQVTATFAYKADVEQTCWGQRAPSPIYIMIVYERRGSGWAEVARSETPAAR